MLKTFTFAVGDNGEAAIAGNMDLGEALQVLQQLYVAHVKKQAVEEASKQVNEEDKD